MYSRRNVAFSNRAQLCVATSNHQAWPLMRTPHFSAAPRSAQTAADLRLRPGRSSLEMLVAVRDELFVSYLFAVALGIGIVAGLRALTAPAVVAWAAHLGW